MMNSNLLIPRKVVLSLSILLLLSACSEEAVVTDKVIQTVKTIKVIQEGVVQQRRFTGRIVAVSTIDLSFQVSGKLIALPIKKGAKVAKGEVIARLDDSDFKLALQQASAQFNLAKLDVTRKRNLFASGSLPKSMLDQAETNYQLMQLALRTAERNLSYTKIIAPYDALVNERLVDIYTNVMRERPIIQIQELTELRVRINIPENMMAMLGNKEDFNAVAIFKDRPTERFPLAYREHKTEASSIAQTYELNFGLSREKNLAILPGMTAAVILSLKQQGDKKYFFIPVTALSYDAQNKPRVWVLDPSSHKVKVKLVKLGEMKEQGAMILSGLKAGDEIVTAGAHLLREDMLVRRFISF
jgi:RND family efflux transporter MFP subunit